MRDRYTNRIARPLHKRIIIMTMSVKMLADIATHAQAMADEAQAMAAAIKIVVDDCAEQLAAKKTGNEAAVIAGKAAADPEWVAEAEASVVNEPLPNSQPAKKHTITEVRAFVAERTKPENRAQIKAILKGLGATKLTELPEDKYGLLMDEVSKL